MPIPRPHWPTGSHLPRRISEHLGDRALAALVFLLAISWPARVIVSDGSRAQLRAQLEAIEGGRVTAKSDVDGWGLYRLVPAAKPTSLHNWAILSPEAGGELQRSDRDFWASGTTWESQVVSDLPRVKLLAR